MMHAKGRSHRVATGTACAALVLLACDPALGSDQPLNSSGEVRVMATVGRPRVVVHRREASGVELPPTPLPPRAIVSRGSGIHLYPPVGSKPPRAGLIVPEDFELPPGYMRHYQTGDDGTPLPAILMFHPDYEVVDPEGRPVEIPEDRIVPPELAPAGLPLQILKVPTPQYPAPPRHVPAPPDEEP